MQTSRRRTLLLALAAAVIVAPTPAEGQIGGFIKKKVGDRIADKVLGDDSKASGAGRARPPEFSEDVVEITGARLDQLIKGIDAEVAVAGTSLRNAAEAERLRRAQQAQNDEARRQYDAKLEAHNAAMEKYQSCQMAAFGSGVKQAMSNPAAVKMAEATMKLPPAERDAFQKRMEAREKQLEAADRRNDVAAATRIRQETDADMKKTLGVSLAELQAGGAGSGNAVARLEAEQARCGEAPVAPVEPQESNAEILEGRDQVRNAAFKASGLTPAQYSIMRERVAAWLAAREKKRDGPGGYGFTDAELAALDERYAALKPRAKAIIGENLPGGWFF